VLVSGWVVAGVLVNLDIDADVMALLKRPG
jgi:hypothetical protein